MKIQSFVQLLQRMEAIPTIWLVEQMLNKKVFTLHLGATL